MMRGDSVGGDGASMVLGALKSRYSCISKPLPPATTGGLDNDPRYLHRLWVFGSRDDKPNSPPAASSFKPTLDLNITRDPHMIKDNIKALLLGLRFCESRMLVQFWSPVTIQKGCSLTTLDQPFGLGAFDEGLYMYRLESEQRMYVIEEEHTEELGSPGRVYCQKLPEWSFGINTLPVRQHVQDLAARYDIHGYINLPVFEPGSGGCVGVLELLTSSNCIDFAFEVREVLRALKEENLKSSFQDEIQIEPSIFAAAEGTGQSFVPCLDARIEDFDINPGTSLRNKKRSGSLRSLEDIENHIGKPISVVGASRNVGRSTLRRCRRNLGIQWPNRRRKRTQGSVGLKKINKKHYRRKTMKELVDILDVVVSRFVKRFRKSRGILRRQYRNGPGKSDTQRKLGQTEIHTSEEASNEVFGERLGTTNGLATLTEHDKHSSMRVPHQQEQTELYNENSAATSTEKILTLEVTYRHTIAKFCFRISEGLVKLEELVATRFQLDFGSFKLKYVDADGDLILIACDSALTESVGDSKQMDHQTVIRLLVLPVIHQSPNVQPYFD